MTDGAVSDSSRVIDLAKRNKAQARVFALGLGASASRHLVKGIARYTIGKLIHVSQLDELDK